MKNKKKEILLVGLGIVSILVVIVGVTYAFFTYTKQGSTNNVIETGTIKFLYDEKYGYGNGIQITDAVPMSDELGKKQQGDNQVFDFKIVSTTMSKTAIPYTITVKKYDSNLDDKFIKLYLTKVEGASEEELVLSKFNGETGENYLDSYKGSTVERILYKGNVPSGKTDYEINYRLRMWIDEYVDFSPTGESGESPYNGQSFKIRVNVYANGASLDEEGLTNESKAEIKTLSLGGEEIDPTAADDKLYETTLPEGTTSTTVDIETESEYASVKIEKTDSNYNSLTSMNTGTIERMSTKRTLSLTSGDNYFKITVTSEDKKVSQIRKLHIYTGKMRLVDAIFQKYQSKKNTVELDNDITSENFAFNNTSESKGQNGLYKATYTIGTGEEQETKTSYYFRGNVNNYLEFAGQLWRVIRINEDGSIRIILQNGINENTEYMIGSACKNVNCIYYSNWPITTYSGNSSVKKALDDWYNTEIASNETYTNRLATGTGYFCEQFKVSEFSNQTGTLYSEYSPTFKCENDQNGYGVVPDNPKVGLISYDEVVMAGGYYQMSSNYYLYNSNGFWTMSVAGHDSGNDWYSWYVARISKISDSTPDANFTVRPVINLNPATTVEGNGTSDSHWVVTN